uniref:DUF761 domain-containing protein n=1 Tax=Nymphaea colorata TaxID=210225 RepID=A0A5K1AYN8_9MAGN
MEMHLATRGKRLCNLLRVAFFMMRKGVISKRKLVMDLNLMMKRGKLLGKSLRGLVFHHRIPVRGYGRQDYEFSCTNSPNPVFFHAGKKKLHNYLPSLPCINPPEPAEPIVIVKPPLIQLSPDCSSLDPIDFMDGEKFSPSISPLPIVISSYYPSEDDENDGEQVDEKAEEFIARFYEQLRTQGRIALVEYQEREYQEMLARGCR